MPTRPLSGLAQAAKMHLQLTDDERFTKPGYYLQRELIAGWLLCSIAMTIFLVTSGVILHNAILGGCGLALLYAGILPGIGVLCRVTANLSALRQYGDKDLVVPSLSVLMNNVHKCEVPLDMTAAEAYEHSLKALHSLKTARVEKINILQGSITAVCKSSVRLKIDIQPVSENKSTLKLVSEQIGLSLREDEVLANLLQLRQSLLREHTEWYDLTPLFQGYRWHRLRAIGSTTVLCAAVAGVLVLLTPSMWRGQEEAYARAYFTLGDYQSAYSHAKNASSERGSTLTMLSAALSGNIDEARSLISADQGLKDNPANTAFLSALEGKYDQADKELEQETDSYISYETGMKHFVRGLIAKHNGELKKAVEEFDVAMQLGYSDSSFMREELLRVLSKQGKHDIKSAHIDSLDTERTDALNSIHWGPATLLAFALLWLGIFVNYVRTEKARVANDYFLFQRESANPCS